MHLGSCSLSHMLIFNIALQIQLNGPSLLPYCIKRHMNRTALALLCLEKPGSSFTLASTLLLWEPLPNVVVFEEFHMTLYENEILNLLFHQ